MKKKILYIFLAVTIISLAFNAYIILKYDNILHSETIRAEITVENRTAVKLTDDGIMHFGSISPGFTSVRTVTLSNNYDFPLTIKIKYSGPSWLYLSNNNFMLQPHESKNVTISAEPPLGARQGDYSWDITINFVK